MKTNYTNDAQQRLLQLVDLLAGHEINGLEPGAIAKALRVTASAVTRDLDNLRTAGWAEVHPNGRSWRLTPHVVQMSLRYSAALHAAAQAFSDLQQRYGSAPHQSHLP